MSLSQKLVYRRAEYEDIPAMAEIRAADWGTAEDWRTRILAYMQGTASPRQALGKRAVFVCVDGNLLVGLTAGHLTRRFGCDAELQWISVKTERRNRGIASELLRCIVGWFVEERARRVCVDVEPSNIVARKFYAGHGAVEFKPSWMIWHDIAQVLPASRQS
jgi:ribosomal protein S18 acetylase RimI-like enzyme